MNALELIDLAHGRGAALWVDEGGELHVGGTSAGLDGLLPLIETHHQELITLLRWSRPGEREPTGTAVWPCLCCRRYFTEVELDAGSWCHVCLVTVDRVDKDLKQNPKADLQTVAERHVLDLARFLGLPAGVSEI